MSVVNKLIGGLPLVTVYPGEVDDSDNGAGVDFNAYGTTFAAMQLVGAVGGSDPVLQGKIQESANGVSWSDVPLATFTNVTGSNNIQSLTATRSLRYLRHTRTVSGTSPTFILSAFFIPLTDAIVPGVATMPSVVLDGTADAIIVPAPTGNQKIRVHAFSCGSTVAETIRFNSYLAGDVPVRTALTGQLSLEANAPPIVVPYSREGYFDCALGEALELDKSGSGTLGGWVNYSIVPAS